jgi:predicted nuclease of restriction endonuclease-like (RecB) superfamily
MTLPALPDDYSVLLNEVREILDTARTRAYQAVDNLRVQAYWQVGERVVRAELEHKDRADYGARVLERLAHDLAMTRQTLSRIVRFYRTYPLVTTLRAQLAWSHYELLSALDDAAERTFYESEVVRNAWSVRQLDEEIKSGRYRRALRNESPTVAVARTASAVRAEDAFRSLYSFAVPGLPGGFDEAQLEEALLTNFERFLAELGPGFYVRRSQQPLVIDGQYHTVDLELYNRDIPAVVLVDLKVGPFRDGYVGQMNKYVSYYRERMPHHEWERPTIGLIVCESAGRDEVRYTLAGLEERIFVAEYQVRLPTERVIKERLEALAEQAGTDAL